MAPAVAVQVDPDCVTVTALPAIVRIPERWAKLFCPTDTVTVPVPLPDAVGLIQGAFDVAVQEQNPGMDKDKLGMPTLESKVSEDGVMRGSKHEP